MQAPNMDVFVRTYDETCVWYLVILTVHLCVELHLLYLEHVWLCTIFQP